MALLSGLLAVALFAPNPKADLPLGTWKMQGEGEVPTDLVITEVKPDGKLEGAVFGKPLNGTWDGTVLSFRDSRDYNLYRRERTFSARLVREKQGAKEQPTLTGMRTDWLSGCYIDMHLPAGAWKAHLKAPAKQKDRPRPAKHVERDAVERASAR
jgi:hypothetical protein